MSQADFVIVGSSGGGGTIAWLLAKNGFNVVVLELGDDWSKPLKDSPDQYNPIPHDEYRYRLARPELKRHPRGDYNTYRPNAGAKATPIGAGWTASMLGGGSVIWGAWSFRPLPVDHSLATHFKATGQAQQLKSEGYAVADWPVSYREVEPYYNLAEALLAACGDRDQVTKSVLESDWYQAFKDLAHFQPKHDWRPTFPFPNEPFPLTPVGWAVALGMEGKWRPAPLPSGMVRPVPLEAVERGSGKYSARAAIANALTFWKESDRPRFWQQQAEQIWSDRTRDPCTMCGYCGEFLCWGKDGPKSGSLASTLRELEDLPNARVILNAKAYELVYDPKTKTVSGVRYIDTSKPDDPRPALQEGGAVIVSCGAVQSARLLLMSGPRGGLGNENDQVGRNVMFHLFGLGSTYVLPGPEFQGMLHGELGHTGNTTSYGLYFVKDKDRDLWWKGGTIVSTAKKNVLENAVLAVDKGTGQQLLQSMEDFNRTLEIRLTGDDLPMPSNRVDLDPKYVDEHGLPVARITRDFGPAEQRMFALTKPHLDAVWEPFLKLPRKSTPNTTGGNLALIGDHQMGTCRMGDDPGTSVLDRNCRVHGVANLYVVDSSFMPSGHGLNPMVSVVANALRVGTWIVDQAGKDAVVS